MCFPPTQSLVKDSLKAIWMEINLDVQKLFPTGKIYLDLGLSYL